MDYILFDDIEDQLPLIDPEWFRSETEYGYDPVTQAKNPDVNPVTEYWTSFLTTSEQFNLVRIKLLAQLNQYRTNGEVTRLPITVAQEQSANIYDGTYEVFWVLEHNWFERLGSDKFRVNLHGYGVPIESFGSILPNQVFTVSESALIGSVVGIVEGFNAGSDIESNPNVPFSYNPATGTLAVSKKLDYESEAEYTVTIGTTPLTIYVLDEAETPYHERTDYVFYTQRSSSPGSVIGSVTASIQGESGLAPQYAIVSGNSGGNFSIDPFTGDIVVLTMVGISDNHILSVNDGHGTLLTCTLRVLDAPIFPTYRFTISSTVQVGAVVGVVAQAGYTLSYSDGIFELQGTNLVVANTQDLQPGTYEISIDTGTDTPVQCFIYVSAVSDFEFWIPSDSSNGTQVGNPGLNYDGYQISPSSIFGINSVTGDIYVVASSLLTPSTYNITISDTGGLLTTPIAVVVYAVATEADFEFTVAPDIAISTVVGNIGGTAPYSLKSGSFGEFTLGVTGDITVSSTPVSSTQFTVTDDLESDITVVITASDSSVTGDDAFIGTVVSGQQGQSVATLANVLFSIGPVGFGQGSLTCKPDNTAGAVRTLAGSVVVGLPASLTYTLSVSADVTQAMLDALEPIYQNSSTLKVSVPGKDWDATMVELSYNYSDSIGVSLVCMSS
jgi:hypothetical protein